VLREADLAAADDAEMENVAELRARFGGANGVK